MWQLLPLLLPRHLAFSLASISICCLLVAICNLRTKLCFVSVSMFQAFFSSARAKKKTCLWLLQECGKQENETKKRYKQNWVKIVRQPEVAVAVSEILHRYGVCYRVWSPSYGLANLQTPNPLKCVFGLQAHTEH